MKIAILSFFNGSVERGLENWVSEISLKLSKKHEIKVFRNMEKVNWSKKSSVGTLTRRFFLDYWSIVIAKFTFKLLATLWKEDFEVIIPTNGGWQTLLIRFLTWGKGSKMIVIGHSGKGWDDRFNLWCFPDTFIALTNYAQAWAKKINPFIKIVNITNGVNLEKFSPNGKKIQTDLKNPLVLCVSALVRSKRIDLTIKAVSLLNDVNLLIVGKGEIEGEIRSLGEELLGKRFQLISLPFDKMPECYRAADIFTLASWESEAFPLVYLEAMASNLPVVATDDSVRKEIIGEAGILVNPKDTNAYSCGIKEALEKKWGNKPRHQAEKFSWEIITEKYDNVINTLK